MSLVVITGANRGIGLAMARQYLARGEEVVAACRRPSAELEASGAEVVPDIDVREPASLDKLLARLDRRRIDILVNNAGILSSQSLDRLDESAFEAIREQFEVNAMGPLRVTHTLLPKLDKGARIGIVTSRMGSIGDNSSGGSYGYRMSKVAANMAGVSLAQDLKRRGIAVALLHPGFVRTEMTGREGNVGADEAAAGLIERLDQLELSNTGRFWHANGEQLPW
jgi:NAD(P)-dependent dehydrogenase (short-subunit alcohol dehydrogenase family)